MSGGSSFPAGSQVPLNMRGTPWQDQVPRREAFEAAHPEVVITPPGRTAGALWRAVVPGQHSNDMFLRYELCDLLDALEALFADGDPP
jgi:hypothetical protein